MTVYIQYILRSITQRFLHFSLKGYSTTPQTRLGQTNGERDNQGDLRKCDWCTGYHNDYFAFAKYLLSKTREV